MITPGVGPRPWTVPSSTEQQHSQLCTCTTESTVDLLSAFFTAIRNSWTKIRAINYNGSVSFAHSAGGAAAQPCTSSWHAAAGGPGELRSAWRHAAQRVAQRSSIHFLKVHTQTIPSNIRPQNVRMPGCDGRRCPVKISVHVYNVHVFLHTISTRCVCSVCSLSGAVEPVRVHVGPCRLGVVYESRTAFAGRWCWCWCWCRCWCWCW